MEMNRKLFELLLDNYGDWRYQNKNTHVRMIPNSRVDNENSEGLIYIGDMLLEGGFKFSIEKYYRNLNDDFAIAYDIKILDRKSKVDEVIKLIQE